MSTPAPAGSAGDGAAVAAPPGPGPARLDLTIPEDFSAHPPPLTPAQEAMRDPLSNHLELTKQEKLDMADRIIECVAWQREPDGSIYRGPGTSRASRASTPIRSRSTSRARKTAARSA